MTNIHNPLSDRVIFKQIDLEFKSAGGLYLGEIENDRETMYGKVIAVGRGKWVDGGLVPMECKEGDIIVLRHNAPIAFNYKGEILHTINESSIIEIIKDPFITEKTFTKEGYEYDASNSKIIN